MKGDLIKRIVFMKFDFLEEFVDTHRSCKESSSLFAWKFSAVTTKINLQLRKLSCALHIVNLIHCAGLNTALKSVSIYWSREICDYVKLLMQDIAIVEIHRNCRIPSYLRRIEHKQTPFKTNLSKSRNRRNSPRKAWFWMNFTEFTLRTFKHTPEWEICCLRF